MEEIIKTITPLVTALVIILLGQLSKKYDFVNKNLLPIQNNIIALIVALIEYALTKDFNYLTVASGLFASGVYDIVHGAAKDSESKKIILVDTIINKDEHLDMVTDKNDIVEEVE